MSDQPERDDVDAILSDAVVDGDLTLLAAVMHDMRAEYVTAGPLVRSPSLLAFTAPETAPVSATVRPLVSRVGRRGLQAASVGLVTKLVLGTTLVAASVGVLQAADPIELPGLPDSAADQAVEVRPATVEPAAAAPAPDPTVADDDSDVTDKVRVTDHDTGGAQAGAAPGMEVSIAAHLNRDESAEFVASNAMWHECASDLPPSERVEVCGDRPHPADYGLTDPPGKIARDESATAGSPAVTAPGRTRDARQPAQPTRRPERPEQPERETGRP